MNALCIEIYNNFLEDLDSEGCIFPSRNAYTDYSKYVNFKKTNLLNFEKYPMIEACFSELIKQLIVDYLIIRYQHSTNSDITIFKNLTIVKNYFFIFKNLKVEEEFNRQLRRLISVPGGGDSGTRKRSTRKRSTRKRSTRKRSTRKRSTRRRKRS